MGKGYVAVWPSPEPSKTLKLKTKVTKQKTKQNNKWGVWRGLKSIRENGVETQTPKKKPKKTSAPQPQGHF